MAVKKSSTQEWQDQPSVALTLTSYPVHPQRQAPGRGGLLVDGSFRCSAPGGGPLDDVFAVGDVAAFPLLMQVGGAAPCQCVITK